MEHIIIRETCSEMRAIARRALRGNWKGVAVAMALYYLLMVSIPSILDIFLPGATIDSLSEVTGETVSMPFVSSIYTIILTGPFELGVVSFFIYFFRRRELHPGHLFDGFEHFIKAVLLTFAIGIRILLWSLLLIVPGLIAAFRYSQAFYILADHPEYSVRECINQSKHYMEGNKGKLLLFALSFLGWAILYSIKLDGSIRIWICNW